MGLFTSVRTVLAAGVIAVGGFIGMVVIFSDYPSEWSQARWMLTVVAFHACAGCIVGLCLPRHWYVSVATAWGAVLITGGPAAVTRWREGVASLTAINGPDLQLGLFWVPAAAVLSGFLGGKTPQIIPVLSAGRHRLTLPR